MTRYGGAVAAVVGVAVNLPGWMQAILVAAGVIALLAGTVAKFRQSYNETTIRSQNEAIAALEKNGRLRDAENIEQAAKIKKLEETNQVLKDLATGTSTLATNHEQMLAIERQQGDEHEQLIKLGETMVRRIDKLRDQLAGKPTPRKRPPAKKSPKKKGPSR